MEKKLKNNSINSNFNKKDIKNKNNNMNMNDLDIQKPFLKWVGGKTQIINNIIDKFPKKMSNYHELFLGGGSVLLAVLSLQKLNKITIKNKIYAYDVNDTLIGVYRNIQKNKDKIFDHITYYLSEYDNLTGNIINRNPKTIEEAKTSTESYYYWLRNKFNNMNRKTVEGSALFMILNKTCFRGMYREGPKGFNVPYGHYKTTPTIITKENLDNVYELIKNVKFIKADFNESIKKIKKGDFVYLDPPYAPENKKSFVGYTANGFDLETHYKLFNEIKKLKDKKIRFVMSNAKVDLVLDNFKDYKYDEIVARRAINSKKPGSSTIEVIIYDNFFNKKL